MYFDKSETCEQAVSVWGEQAQIDVAIEECSELIAALIHYRRRRASVEYVAEEIADVLIMVQQLSVIFGYDQVNMALHRKMERLISKLDMEADAQRAKGGAQKPYTPVGIPCKNCGALHDLRTGWCHKCGKYNRLTESE